MHEILNSNTMTMEDQKTFGEMLRFIFSNPKEDIHIQRGLPTDGSDGSSVSILKSKFASYLSRANATFFTLTDQNGLSILGYSLLTCKSGIITAFCEHFNETKSIVDFVTDNLNKELAFVITHRVPYQIPQEVNNLVKNVFRVLQSFKKFMLSEENTKLLGKRLIISEFNNWNKTSESRMQAYVAPDDGEPFQIPSVFVAPPPPPQQYHATPPPQQYHAPPLPYSNTYIPPPSTPPPPLPYNNVHIPPPAPPLTIKWGQPGWVPPPPDPPPPPQYHAPPPPPPQYHAPPPLHRGGTRKNYKRHKKQIRKHASKKIKHDK